jgi:transcriptional regulator with XRE-family HTH domain
MVTLERLEEIIELKSKGLSLREVAIRMSLAKNYVKKVYTLRKLAPEIRSLLESEKITLGRAYQLTLLSHEEQIKECIGLISDEERKKTKQ